jgi:hypothetical protein
MIDTFETRRHKEGVAFLVVKFLRVAIAFDGIAREFRARLSAGDLARSGLCDRLRELTESLAFDLKEKAHALFRSEKRNGAGGSDARDMRRILSGMKVSIERRTIDSYVGTGYHLLLILQEALYQVERYAPELEREKEEIQRLLSLADESEYPFTREERAELARLRTVDEISATLARDSVELAERIMTRCEGIMSRTSEVMRRFIASGSDNEILVLNLLENRDLVEAVYGAGAAEAVLGELCGPEALPGPTGVARAVAFVRARCGNVTGVESISS